MSSSIIIYRHILDLVSNNFIIVLYRDTLDKFLLKAYKKKFPYIGLFFLDYHLN